MPNNSNLRKAQTVKNDEFYTQMIDIEKELQHYKEHFKDKIIYCNCDNPRQSNFWKYFHLNFNHFGLKKLIATHYDSTKPTYKITYTGGNDTDFNDGIITNLATNGDFRSPECIELLQEADMVVTNPPFSCYSSDTEVMTDKGWKYIKDVDINIDLIISLNPKTKQIEIVKAVDFIASPVNGELYHFHSHNMDFCVTGNHKMYAYSKNAKGENVFTEMKDAENIKASNLLPLVGFSWEGEKQDFFTLKSVKQKEQYSRKEIIIPDKKIPMDDWLEFFGFYLADGCYRDHINTHGKRDYTISIKQNKQNEEYVLNLIQKIGFKAEITRQKNSNNNYNIYSKQLYLYLSQFGRSCDKYIPREFLKLDAKHLKNLFKGYKNGDSHKNGNSINLSSVSKKLMEDMQEIILKTFGQISYVRTINATYENKPYTYYMISLNENLKHRSFAKYGKPDKIKYNDNVYCLTLEKNHIMLTRHNGVIGWCGNCFREYIAQLIDYDKKFIVIGNKNSITYKEFFPLLKDNQVWIGFNSPKEFVQPDNSIKKFGNISWFTNLDIIKRHEFLDLIEKYTPEKYPKYDNYDAINVDKVLDIPVDYGGVMGVPITFMDKYNPDQFEIVGFCDTDSPLSLGKNYNEYIGYKQDRTLYGRTGSTFGKCPVLVMDDKKHPYYEKNGIRVQATYHRVFIRKKSGV